MFYKYDCCIKIKLFVVSFDLSGNLNLSLKNLLPKMKLHLVRIVFLCFLGLNVNAQDLKGAWYLNMQTAETTILITDTYFTYTLYNHDKKEFNQTWGGSYTFQNDEIVIKIEFNFLDSTEVGKDKKLKVRLVGDFLKYSVLTFRRLDNANETDLVGVWQIEKRANEKGEMYDIPNAARKTVKILTGTRFQWVAMNTETKQFFGTGGGKYTFENGVYTENIEFFSRDSERVGTSLSFKDSVKDDLWLHTGKSTTGNAISEIWKNQ